MMARFRSFVVVVPLVIVASLLVGGAVAFGLGMSVREHAVQEEIVGRLQAQATRIALLAERLLATHPALVEEQLMFFSIALDTEVALLLDPDGNIRMAHDSLLKGRAAAELLTAEDIEAWAAIAQGRPGKVGYPDAGNQVDVLYPFDYPATDGAIGSQARGGIYLRKDITDPLRAALYAELMLQLPLLLTLLALAAGISLWLHLRLVRPLRTVADASRRLISDPGVRVSDQGVYELGELNRAFNEMAAQLKTQQDELRANLDLMSAILEQAPDAIELADPQNLRIVEANPASCELLGYTREERLRQRVPDFQVGLTPARIGEMLDAVDSDGHASFTTQHRRKDGSLIDVQVRLRGLHLRERDYLLAIWRDVTAEKAAQQRLTQLYMAVEQSPESIVITDPQGLITYVNPGFEQTTGYRSSEVMGKNINLLRSDETPRGVIDDMWAQLRAGQPWHGEFQNRRKDGSPYVEMTSISPVHDREGRLTHYLAIKEDITERRRLQEELERHRSHLEELVAERTTELARMVERQSAIFETASAGIVFVRERVILQCNRRWDEILGYDPGEQLGQSTRIWYPDEDDFARAGREAYPDVWAGRTHTREQALCRRDGTRVCTRMTGRALDPGDPQQGSVWVIDDISLEREAHAQLEEARRLAEASAQTKTNFLANMSHEIRTPMNAVMGMSHLLGETTLDERQRSYLGKIETASQHLLGIINDILDLSKIEAGKLPIEQIQFDLDEVLGHVVDMVGARAAAKGLELILWIESDVPTHLLGDPLRLGQILTNFASNAVKFTESGDITLHVSVRQHQPRQLELLFEVIDTGIGLSEEQRGRLFQPFEQADAGTTRRFGGTGLGLAISRQLADLMRGRIGVSSQLHAGANFWVSLPFQRSTVHNPMLADEQALQGRRLLLIEPQAHVRDALVDMLEGMGLAVTASASASAAFAAVTTGNARPEVILIDSRLPDLDALEAARGLRQRLTGRLPQIALICAPEHRVDDAAATAAGIASVLVKPVPRSTLQAAVMRLLDIPGELTATPSPALTQSDISTLAGARVLLVEDNELNREVAVAMLEGQAGMRVATAENGAVAVEMARAADAAGRYDVILMDMQMPVMDGLTASREILALPGWNDVPILAMTASALEEDREASRAAGLKGHIAKPVEPEQLWRELLRWTRRPVRPAPAAAVAVAEAEATAPLLPATLPGLDLASARRQALGRESLLLWLLRKFVTRHQDFVAGFRELLAAGDAVAAEREAHSLKGNAAQIGAVALREAAYTLERAVHALSAAAPPASSPEDSAAGRAAPPVADGDAAMASAVAGALPPTVAPTVAEALEAVAATLATVLETLERHLPPSQPAAVVREAAVADAMAPDPAQVLAVCAELRRRLDDSDTASQALVQQHGDLLRQAFGPDFERIARWVEDFDFALASDELQALETAWHTRNSPP